MVAERVQGLTAGAYSYPAPTHALYLAAESIGLAARNLAAFLDDTLNELLEVDRDRQAVVHLTMAGPGN